MIINPYINNNYYNIGSGTAESVTVSSGNTTSNVNAAALSHILNGGDTVAGEILSKSGGSVTISLGDGSIVSAKLDISADIQVGASILFNVKSSDSNGLVLSPLFTNMNTENPGTKALISAGLMANDKNLMMVNSMMQEGMNVGRSELLAMSNSLENVSVLDIPDAVVLHKLGIEVNSDNIEQFGLYKNYEHQISGAVNEIMDLVTDSLAEMTTGEGNVTNAMGFATELLDIFTSNGAIFVDDNEMGLINAPVSELISVADQTELVELLKDNGLPTEFGEAIMNGEVSLKDLMYVLDDLVKSNLQALDEQTEINTPPVLENIIEESKGTNDSGAAPDQNVGLDFLKALAQNKEVAQNEQDNNIHQKVQTDAVAEKATDAFLPDRDSIVKLVSSKSFGNILKTAINAEWKLIPEQVGEDKQVSNLYKRITEQTNRLIDSVNNRAQDDSPLAQKAAELNKNVNFMNEMNNMFNYVQLPMRMAGNDAHGELYVYSNKKHMASEDGTVSALLHLDMDHLGPTDIYVTMNASNHVNTHFYLQDDYSLDLIAEHIGELNTRLEKRGYNLNAEFSTRDEMSNVMNEIIEDNKLNVPLSASSFDARA